ncbi:amidohydrolase family protein [Microbacterium sp. QXD-8]|uniref:Amidohydrolase family protein n=1 Tax=Microbacterium psychrotolerans TaxID=3068321 RepID=A0ABU0YY24_9MICO|nr:amidohydrolase family protein [Microbacterium sp. QXD-8]MDQ7876660.1 amidohydrolase family protein [Microbacterium sp. QXD-8]
MTLVDSHVHIWDPDLLDYAWLGGTGLDHAMLPPDVDRAATVSTEMIFVQASDGDPLAEARWVDRLAWPELIAIVAGADLTRKPEEVEAHLAALAEIPRVVGVRHLLQDTAETAFSAVREGLRILADRGGTFDACIRHPQLSALIDLLDAVPDLTVVLDHLGKPPVDEGIDSPAGRRWSEQIGILAARPRTYVKLSGLAPESSDAAAFGANVDAFIDRGLEAFGSQRAMIGSDWPVSSHFGMPTTFTEWAARVERIVGASDWPAVSSTTARSVYLPGGASRLHAP